MVNDYVGFNFLAGIEKTQRWVFSSFTEYCTKLYHQVDGQVKFIIDHIISKSVKETS